MTKKYAVVGNPVEHSLSPKIHGLFAEQTQQDLSYEKILIKEDQFFESVKELIKKGYKGLNVTVPFKQQAYELCDELSKRAKDAAAVNTLVFRDSGVIFGDNTDGIGMMQDIQVNLKFSIKDKAVLIIGAGGAARGVINPVLAAKPSSLTITNRTVSKARDLADYFQNNIQAVGFDELQVKYDCIISATSMGLSDAEFPLSGKILKSTSLCYDMVYGKETNFTKWAKENQAALVADGLGMLVEQAADSFCIWHDVRPSTTEVFAKLR